MPELPQTLSALSVKTNALVSIGLQHGVLSFAQGSYSAKQVLSIFTRLARCSRELTTPMVLVRVGWTPGYTGTPRQLVDRPTPIRPGGLSPQWQEQPAELEVAPTDIQIIERRQNALYDTEPDLQLRYHDITTIVLGGILIHVDMESTARATWERGCALVPTEDAMSPNDAIVYRSPVENVFPRLGRVRNISIILSALAA